MVSTIERPADAPARQTPWWRRPSRIIAVCFVIHLLLAMATNPAGHLSTDVGGKVASVVAMDARGDWDPDIGYWFAEADSEGRFHPLANTLRTDDGRWINTTSLTMVLPTRGLWAIGGPRLAAVLPILGSLAAALAAGALHRRLRAGSDGAESIWIVALASPATVYALDLWEHSWGLALMTAGIIWTLDASGPRHGPGRAALVGVAFGLAATMRQEALVYGFVAGGVLVGSVLRTRGWLAAARNGVATLASTIAVLGANAFLEDLVLGGSIRSARGVGTIAMAGSGVGARLEAGLMTTTYAFATTDAVGILIGGALVVLSLLVGLEAARPSDGSTSSLRAALLAAWGAWLLLTVVSGPGFVPGLAIAAPLAAFGLVGAFQLRRWSVATLGVLPVPLVIATAFADGALPQWGGRYLLTTGLVLTVLAIVWLNNRSPRLLRTMACVSLVVTGVGVAWTIERTHAVAEDGARIVHATEGDVVVWRSGLKARELGSMSVDQTWLSAPFEGDRSTLTALLRESGVRRFHWVGPPDLAVRFAGFRPVGSPDETTLLEFLEVQIVTFEAVQP